MDAANKEREASLEPGPTTKHYHTASSKLYAPQGSGRAWVPNSATWNGCFADPDSPPGVLDSPFVPEREFGEFLCSGCFLICSSAQMSPTHGICRDCE